MSEIKIQIGSKLIRNPREFLTFQGLSPLRGMQGGSIDNVYTLIFKSELNPLLKYKDKLKQKIDPYIISNLSYMNENFYNLFRISIGDLFWQKEDVKEILLTNIWHSFMYLSTNDGKDDGELLTYLMEMKNFISRYEFVLECNGIENPQVVITFENNFLLDTDWEVILNDFHEITANYEKLPTYCLQYLGNPDPNMRIFSFFR